MCITEFDEKKFVESVREEGREEGRIEGEQNLARLLLMLEENGREEDIKAALVDKGARDRLYEEFGIMSVL